MEFASVAMEPSAPPVVEEEPQLGKHLRNQLAAAVRSINWSYAIFWSNSSSYPGVLTWKDGFYNDEIKTRRIANTLEFTAEQLILQRSEQLRELYESLLSGRCKLHRPIASLSPEDLGDVEWYYIISMTYAFGHGQGLPGRSFESKEHVWLCNAHLADSKTFPRALVAKKASLQTIVCIPLRGGVLELGTTASVLEDPDLLNRATTSFEELKFRRCTEDPSTNKTEDANDYVIRLDNLDQDTMETDVAELGHEIGEADYLFSNKLEQVIKEFDDFFDGSLAEPAVQSLQESRWIMDGSSLVSTPFAKEDYSALSKPGCSSRTTSFLTWTRFQSDEWDWAVPAIREPQKLLKKVVAGRAWTNKIDGENTASSTQESSIKKHVISERRRREKLNEMFQVLNSLVPTIRKMDKASILAETIAYLKDLERKVKELESRMEPISSPNENSPRRHDSELIGKAITARAKRKKASKLSSDIEMEHQWVCSEDGVSNVVNVTVIGTEVLLEVQCRWKEFLMTQVFDTIKSLYLDVLSVEASTPNYLLSLKIRAKPASRRAFLPDTIREALRRAVASHSRDRQK